MPLASGTRLGPYEILALIGQGGMGEVYRARDPRLNRDVAIKVSAAQFSERFEREARAVAALNHPNICTLYDVGPNYLVMEFVEGASPKGPLPLEKALDYARQIAIALEAAHEKNIIHRDLKPANIKVRPDGTVKVLDFGLAKHAPGEVGDSADTLTMGVTEAGKIMGTPAYMPPEQARGEPVDRRADIWAFGVVLFEMLTGERMFRGKTASDILAAVLTSEPDLQRVPVELQAVLRHCVAKDLRHRIHHAADVRLMLGGGLPAAAGAQSAKRSLFSPVAAGIIATLAIAAAFLVYTQLRESPPRPKPIYFQVPPPEQGSFTGMPAISPDGRLLAFVAAAAGSSQAVWVRDLGSLEHRLLSGTENTDNSNLFWSFDSRSVVFAQQGRLRKVDVAGGPPQVLTALTGTFRGGSWNREGVIIFATTSGTWRMPEAGSTAALIATLNNARREAQHSGPVFLPDQRHFLYNRTSLEGNGVYVGSIDSKPEEQSQERLIAGEGNPAYMPARGSTPGYILVLREGTLMAQAFDEDERKIVGEAVAVPRAEGIGSIGSQGYFSASANGTLAFRGGISGDRQYTWFDRRGTILSVPVGPGLHHALSLSRDGTHVAGTSGVLAVSDIWVMDFTSRAPTTFTFDPQSDDAAIWSPSGDSIAFSSNRDGPFNLYKKVSSGAGSDEPLLKSAEDKRPTSWSSDGKYLLYESTNARNGKDLMALPMEGDRIPMPVAQSKADEAQGQFSPDTRWVAYRSDESNGSQIWVRPFPPAQDGRKFIISKDGGAQPRWSRDGKQIFFIAPDRRMMTVDVNAAGGAVSPGVPQILFASRIYGNGPNTPHRWDTVDGQKFLVITDVTTPATTPITVVLDWPELLKR